MATSYTPHQGNQNMLQFIEIRQILESVAKPSMMAARWVGQCRQLSNATDLLMPVRWVGQNSGPIFRRLWTKVH